MSDNIGYDNDYGIELTDSQTAGGGFGFGRISSQPEVDIKYLGDIKILNLTLLLKVHVDYNRDRNILQL